MKFASHRFPSFATLLASAVILLCGLNRTQAQVLYGTLTGNVTDSSGAAVPSAKVIALNEGTGINRQAVSDDHGVYVFHDLQAGSYKITVSAPSFATVNEPG